MPLRVIRPVISKLGSRLSALTKKKCDQIFAVSRPFFKSLYIESQQELSAMQRWSREEVH